MKGTAEGCRGGRHESSVTVKRATGRTAPKVQPRVILDVVAGKLHGKGGRRSSWGRSVAIRGRAAGGGAAAAFRVLFFGVTNVGSLNEARMRSLLDSEE